MQIFEFQCVNVFHMPILARVPDVGGLENGVGKVEQGA